LITKTFDDFYKADFNRESVNLKEYLMIKENLIEFAYFIPYLSNQSENLLTNTSMPWLDIGDLPHTYNFQRSEPY